MEHDAIDQLIDRIRKILRDESPLEFTALADLFSELPPKQKTDFYGRCDFGINQSQNQSGKRHPKKIFKQ